MPVIVVSPVLREGINCLTAGLKKPGIKSWQFGVVTTHEPIDGMRYPVIINTLKNRIINSIIVKINKLADGVGSDITIPRDPSSIKRKTILKANLKG